MIVLGIDQSYRSSGVLILNNGKISHYEAILNKTISDKFETALSISERIIALINEYNPLHIAIEGLGFVSNSASQLDLAGLQFIIISDIKRNHPNLTISIIPPTTLKKFATNNGKAKKNEMIEALPKDFYSELINKGYKKSNGIEDISDAYHLANYVFRGNTDGND